MSGHDQFQGNDRLSNFLRESVNDFMGFLDIEERTSAGHEDRVHYEEWVRFCVVTSLVPNVLAAACGVFDYDPEVLNNRMPALIDRSLTTIPVDATFIGDVMSRLPGHERMKAIGDNLFGGRRDRTLADEARDSFNGALYQTLDIVEPPADIGFGDGAPGQ